MLDLICKTRSAVALLAVAAAIAIAPPANADGNNNEPLPRFEDRVCPGIIGLDQEYAELMVTRLRANVQSLGLRLASDGNCDPNLVVAIVDDSRSYLAELMERRSYLFTEKAPAERDEMLADADAAGVWHQVAARTRDGLRVGRSENLVQPPETGMWQAHSRIYRPVRHDITYALVLLNREDVRGLTLRQLADYASLRALATRFPEDTGSTQASMLTLFDAGADRPEGLTPFDRAWLARLYEGIPNRPASTRLRGLRVAEQD